jgi:hypothetical protein
LAYELQQHCGGGRRTAHADQLEERLRLIADEWGLVVAEIRELQSAEKAA